MSAPYTKWLTVAYAPNGKRPKDYRIALFDGEPRVYRPEVDDFGTTYYDEEVSHDQEVLGEAVRKLREFNEAVACTLSPGGIQVEVNTVDLATNTAAASLQKPMAVKHE